LGQFVDLKFRPERQVIADLFSPLMVFYPEKRQLIYQFRKTSIKKLSCTKSNKFFVEYSIGYAI